MRMNSKGFSLIEIMAVLVMTSIILVPLLSGLSDSYKANQRAQHRSNALSVAEGTIYAMDKIDFDEYHDLVTSAQDNDDFVELNQTTCTSAYFTDTLNQGMCSTIFSQVFNNNSFDETTFKVFLFDYKLTSDEYDNITDPDNEDIPEDVKNIIIEEYADSTFTEANVETLIKVIVWIEYYNSPQKTVTLEGLLTGVTTDE